MDSISAYLGQQTSATYHSRVSYVDSKSPDYTFVNYSNQVATVTWKTGNLNLVTDTVIKTRKKGDVIGAVYYPTSVRNRFNYRVVTRREDETYDANEWARELISRNGTLFGEQRRNQTFDLPEGFESQAYPYSISETFANDSTLNTANFRGRIIPCTVG